MNFTYSLGIPDAPNNPSSDQPNMKINNDSVDGIIKIDHYGFNDNSGGKHKQVQLPVMIGDFANVIGQGTLYSKVAGFGSDAQLFWRFANGALSPLQITGPQYSAGTNGYIPLMNGMLLQWGTKSISASGTPTSVLFATSNVNFTNNCFAVYLTGINDQGNSPSANNSFIKKSTVSTTGFTIVNSSGSSTQAVFWLAIGN